MEIELKYKVPTPEIADDIWKDKLFCSVEEDDSREEMCFLAKYFDTPDCDLAKNDIAYRVRKEGSKLVAALKWAGRSEGALHTRQELNVPVCDEKPDPAVFRESDVGQDLLNIIGDKPVYSMMEMRFHRRRFRIDTGTGIFEMSVDEGVIVTPYGEEPISEVELELFSGEQEELEKLGKKLCDEYKLEKEEKSKYARGIKMLKENRLSKKAEEDAAGA